MIAEDDFVLKRFYKQALEHWGADAIIVESLAEAQTALMQHQFDLLITDLKIPDNSALDVMQLTVKRHPGIPILVASGYIQDFAYRQKTENIPNVKGYLEKPFTLDKLVNKLNQIIDSSDNHPCQ